ncbi:recombinase RecT [Halobacillus sp. H74]|uniref:recombinase RecT n=1 Tax=Halobacillus sp. H74 TaxID=3457436 RepID=UPI003FCE903E
MNQVNTQNTASKLKMNAENKKQNQGQQLNVAPEAPKQEVGSTLVSTVKQMTAQLEDSLPSGIKPERIMRIALTSIRNNPKLAQCEKTSFLGSLLEAAQLGLEPNTSLGEGYIIPYYNKDRAQFEASFQMGYQGLLSLAHRTNKYHRIYAHEVFENDEFEFELGMNKRLYHVPADIPKGEPVRYYACYHLKNGGHDFFTWSKDRIEMHAQQFSQGIEKYSSPWNRNFDAMAMKTMLKKVLQYAPKSVELAEQMANDGAVISVDEEGNRDTTYVHEMQMEKIPEETAQYQ